MIDADGRCVVLARVGAAGECECECECEFECDGLAWPGLVMAWHGVWFDYRIASHHITLHLIPSFLSFLRHLILVLLGSANLFSAAYDTN